MAELEPVKIDYQNLREELMQYLRGASARLDRLVYVGHYSVSIGGRFRLGLNRPTFDVFYGPQGSFYGVPHYDRGGRSVSEDDVEILEAPDFLEECGTDALMLAAEHLERFLAGDSAEMKLQERHEPLMPKKTAGVGAE